MVAKNIGIIYSKAQGIIRQRLDTRIDVEFTGEYTPEGQPINRRIIVPGHDMHLEPHKACMAHGEGWAVVPVDIHDSFPEHERHKKLHEYLGLKGMPGIDEYHTIDAEGNVTGVYPMDPVIDAPGGVFKNEDLAKKHKGHRIVKAVP